MWNQRLFSRALLIISFSFILLGCGQKGPLSLPVKQEISPAKETETADGSSIDQSNADRKDDSAEPSPNALTPTSHQTDNANQEGH